MYSIRLLHVVFYGEFRKGCWSFLGINLFIPKYFKYSLSFLCLLSIFSGYCLKSLFLGNSLFMSDELPIMVNQLTVEYIPLKLRLIPIIASFGGLLLYYFYYEYFYEILVSKYKNFYQLLINKFFFDSILNKFGTKLLFKTRYLFLLFDKGLLEVFGPTGIYYFFRNIVGNHLLRTYSNDNFYLHVFLLSFNLLICLGVMSFIIVYYQGPVTFKYVLDPAVYEPG